jgi:hypothetical protein
MKSRERPTTDAREEVRRYDIVEVAKIPRDTEYLSNGLQPNGV